MSKGSLFRSLLLLVCIAQLPPLISSSQVTGDQIGDNDNLILRQDPIRRAPLMSSHGRDELADGHSADSISDDAGGEYGSIDGGVTVEEEEGLLRGDGGGDSGGTNSSKGSSGSGGGGDVECPECGKFFRNDKSMFGHLRSHPNRGYKGAIPPVKKLKLSPDTAAAAAASSSCSLPGTDRTPGQHRSHEPQLSPLEKLCAYVLLTLKYRGSSTTTTQEAVPRPPSSSFGELDGIGQAEGGSGGSVAVSRNVAAEFKCNNAGGQAGNQLGNCDEHGYPVVKIPKKRRNMPKEVREAHRKKVHVGGHVAGHHREKKVPKLNHPSDMAAESQNVKQQQVEDGDDNDKELSVRRGLLSEQFSVPLDVPWQSGSWASGGQRSQHYGRRNDGLSPAVAAPIPTPTPADDGDSRRLWDIDLNVEAPDQE